MSFSYTYTLVLGLEHQKTLLGEPLRERINLSDGRPEFRAFLARAVSWIEERLTELGERACFGREPVCELPFAA